MGVVINAIIGLLGAICKALIKEIYPVIPSLYKLFEYISTYKLLDSAFLSKIWNNIYIFVAVIVLFAIAIKLISAMVNPDTLSDNKKGVRAYYFRSVTAVILIFLIPMLFDYSFELQQDLLSKNYLIGHVFGFELKEGTNVGQVLAFETFRSFCSPVDENELDDDLKDRYLLVQEDVSTWNIMTLFDKMTDTDKPVDKLEKKELKTAFRLYPILCFIVGALVAYELLLLCMDTLFRSAKLAFLEMMTPIVLGAYVFNPEILKKWAKEFFSTYLSLFFKVLALGFMLLSFSQIKSVINQEAAFKDDQILSGLFQAILVIGLLQLVKKIPDLINSIFGTNIKMAGGIKGRLGEMAGIGGLAQKAWTTLGSKAKNLALAGALAAPAGAAAGVGALINAGYKKKFGKDIADTKLGRWTRGIGSGIATAANTGNVGKAFASGRAEYNKLSNDPLDRVRRTADINKKLDGILTNGKGNSVINETNLADKTKAASSISGMTAHYGGKNVDQANKKYQTKLQAQNIAQSMAKNYATVLEENENAAKHLELAGKSDLAAKVRGMSKMFEAQGANGEIIMNGKKMNSMEAMKKFIMDNQDLYGDSDGGNQILTNLIGENGKLTSMERQYKFLNQTDADGKNKFGLSDKDLADLGRGEAAVSFLAGTTLKGKVDSAKADLDVAIAGAKLSDVDKMTVEKLVAAEADINNSMGFAVGRKDKETVPGRYNSDNSINQDYTGYYSGVAGETDFSPIEEQLNNSEQELLDEILSNGVTPGDPEFMQMAGNNANKYKEYYSSKLYDQLTTDEKEFLSDAASEGFSFGDPEFEQMRKDRSLNGKNIINYIKWKK